jgi:hypothetical protein
MWKKKVTGGAIKTLKGCWQSVTLKACVIEYHAAQQSNSYGLGDKEESCSINIYSSSNHQTKEKKQLSR